ncbi:hypothetical protein HPB47_010957 [Ixodes persulcatus]|uniref:Uncharacterized protein n=1 Tax=Ixodes persulcatus TaxID=34615 RepID=A0AC60NXX5_IXOPE|nr:hypothetical protein HPB47_010957 [Ixodes persulcatus]
MLEPDGLRRLKDQTRLCGSKPIFTNDEGEDVVFQNRGLDDCRDWANGDLKQSCTRWEYGGTSYNCQWRLSPGM